MTAPAVRMTARLVPFPDVLASTVGPVRECQSAACRICVGCAANRPAGECRLTVRCPVDGRTRPCRYAPR